MEALSFEATAGDTRGVVIAHQFTEFIIIRIQSKVKLAHVLSSAFRMSE